MNPGDLVIIVGPGIGSYAKEISKWLGQVGTVRSINNSTPDEYPIAVNFKKGQIGFFKECELEVCYVT